MSKMTSEEIQDFLDEIHIASLATTNRDGSPHVIPIWYQYRDGKLYMISFILGRKLYNMRRDSRVSVCVTHRDQPYRYVIIQGNARVTTDDMDGPTTSMCVRYMGQERGTEYARQLMDGGNRVVIVVEPTNIIAYRFGRTY